MATIDQLDISVYNLYAIRTRMLEQISHEFKLSDAATIPPQTQIVDIFPKLAELDLLLGVVPVVTPWAYFFRPKKFRRLRRSPFSFSRVAPTLGSLDQYEEDAAAVGSVECHSPEEEQEKEAMLGCLKQIDKLNDWIGFIIGRVGQFLQG